MTPADYLDNGRNQKDLDGNDGENSCSNVNLVTWKKSPKLRKGFISH